MDSTYWLSKVCNFLHEFDYFTKIYFSFSASVTLLYYYIGPLQTKTPLLEDNPPEILINAIGDLCKCTNQKAIRTNAGKDGTISTVTSNHSLYYMR